MGLRTVLGGIGAAVGFIYGGPAGARWGYMIGSVVGSIVDPQKIKGPSIGDIAAQTSQEGGPIPIVFGMSQPMPGNVIATGAPNIVKSSSSGKGGPKVVTESVFLTYAVGVCEGPITAFRRIWRNNILVFDASENPLIPTEESDAFLEKARLFLGTYDQEASPDLEAVYGVGTTAAHRGIAYMVMAQEDLTDMGGAIPQWQFQVTTGVTATTISNDVLYPWIANTADPRNPLNKVHRYRYRLEDGVTLASWEPLLGLAVAAGNAASDGAYVSLLGWSASDGLVSNSLLKMAPVYSRDAGELVTTDFHFNRYHASALLGTTDDRYGGIGQGIGCGQVRTAFPGVNAPTPYTWWSGLDPDAGFVTTYCGLFRVLPETDEGVPIGMTAYEIGVNNCVGAAWNPLPPNKFCVGSKDYFVETQRVPTGPDNTVLITGSFKVLAQYSEFTNAQGRSVEQYPLNPCLEVGDPNDTEAFWTAAKNAALLAGTYHGGSTYGVDFPKTQSYAWQGETLIVPEGKIPVDAVIEAMAARAAVPADLLDVTQLAGLETYGLTIVNQYPVGQAIQSLADVYRFDATDYDSQIHFILRGGNSVATITEDDMVEDSNEIDAYRRPESIGIPRVFNLIYYDVTGALTTAKQTSERGGDRRSTADISIESAVIMDAAQAAQLVDISHKVLIEEALGELNFQLPDKWIGLVPTDPIIVQWQGRSERVRIVKVMTLDGYQEYTCVRDRQSAYVSTVEGIPPPLPSTPPTRIPGGTLLVVMDIPLVRDVDDGLGVMVYIGVNGITDAWSGAFVEVSRDGGATYTDGTTLTQGPVIGVLTSDLADHPQEYPDDLNTVLVQLQSIDAELEASDLEGMFNGANLAAIGSAAIGWELVQFAGAELQSGDDNTWLLSYFLRGRKDTTTVAHSAGESFVLLTNAALLGAAPMQLTDLGRTLMFRATTSGTAVADGTVVSLVGYRGVSQVERHVGYLEAHRSGSNVVATWQNVGRLGGGMHAAAGAHFDGYRVTVSDGVLGLSVNTPNESETIDVSTLGSPLTVSVLQINNLTGYGPSAEVEIV